MLREMMSPRRKTRVLFFEVDGSAVAAGTDTKNGLVVGSNDGLITENSSGDYTITFAQPGTRILQAQVTTITDVTTARVKAHSKTAVTVEQLGEDQTTPEADADFFLMVVLQDAEDE